MTLNFSYLLFLMIVMNHLGFQAAEWWLCVLVKYWFFSILGIEGMLTIT